MSTTALPQHGPTAPPSRPRGPSPEWLAGRRIEAVGIASSTGGPQVLTRLLGALRGLGTACPILITQHMPSAFIALLAEQLSRAAGRACRPPRDGEPVRPDGIYLAPGDAHLIVARGGTAGQRMLRLDHGEPENWCRPAADPMLRGIAASYGRHALAVVLTGMGQDGLAGCAAVRAAGGVVVVQDEPTSVVWGMPGAVARQGLAHAVLPPDGIAGLLRATLAAGSASCPPP